MGLELWQDYGISYYTFEKEVKVTPGVPFGINSASLCFCGQCNTGVGYTWYFGTQPSDIAVAPVICLGFVFHKTPRPSHDSGNPPMLGLWVAVAWVGIERAYAMVAPVVPVRIGFHSF